MQAERQRAAVELEEQYELTKDDIEPNRYRVKKDANSKPSDKMELPLELTNTEYPNKVPMKFEQVCVREF